MRVLAARFNANVDAADKDPPWVVLWEGPPEQGTAGHHSRAFSPPLRACNFATDVLRLEFNHSGLDYYAQLDAVELTGIMCTDTKLVPRKVDPTEVRRHAARTQRLYRRLSGTGLFGAATKAAGAGAKRGGDRQTDAARASGGALAGKGDGGGGCSDSPFDRLADELVIYVFKLLDFVDILQVSCVSRRFFFLGYRMHMGFEEIDLQPDWSSVTDAFLVSIVERCTNLTHLSLSWSGGGQQKERQYFSGGYFS